MQLHQIQPRHRARSKKRIGRGGKRGTYSGRGIKGQKARAGKRLAPVVRELLKRYPKKRGYRAKTRRKPQTVLLALIAKKFSGKEIVSPESLIAKGLAKKGKGGKVKIKIIGSLDLTSELTFQGCQVSSGARKAIEKSGGKISGPL